MDLSFLEAQGVEVSDNIVYQDNQSTMLLAKNGRQSSGKSTRHLEVQYYFVTDNIRRNRLSLEYCPTEEMIGDFFTKPLQGALFYKLWSLIMNLKSDKSVVRVEAECTASLIEAKESVGSNRCSEKSIRRPVRHPGDFDQRRSYANVVQHGARAASSRHRKTVIRA